MKVKILFLLISLCLLTSCTTMIDVEKLMEGIKITFMVDGEVYETFSFDEGERLAVPFPPEKDGYVFLGWFKEDGSPFDDEFATEPLTLYAKFECYKINLYNYGKLFETVDYIKNDPNFRLPMPKNFIPTGMTFIGWYTEDGYKFDEDVEVSEVLDLYARYVGSGDPFWEYTVNIYVDNILCSSTKYKFGDIVEMPSEYFIELYVFDHWFDEKTGIRYHEFEDIYVYGDMEIHGEFMYDYSNEK